MTITWRDLTLPDFGTIEERPELSAALYAARCQRAYAAAGADWLIVYGDREHSANLSYLTGFDPRFEEAILLLGATGRPVLLAGNECIGLARAAPLPVEAILYQELSLPSQPRDRSKSLAEILSDAGLGRGSRVGVVGWKTGPDRSWINAPAYLVDT